MTKLGEFHSLSGSVYGVISRHSRNCYDRDSRASDVAFRGRKQVHHVETRRIVNSIKLGG